MNDVRIRTVIVDDEPLARQRLRTLLRDAHDFEIVEECADGAKAIQAVETLRPDLLFLDIQMPEINGFDVLMAIDGRHCPLVVFVTAYDQYALKAFEVHALDYLLKPFDDDRFDLVLERVRARLAQDRSDQRHDRLIDFVQQLRSERPMQDRLLVKSGGCITLLDQRRIDWIEAAGNYMKIHAGGEVHLVRETMSSLLKQLNPARFTRIHRSFIVHLERIKEFIPSGKGEFHVILHNKQRLTLSRKYRPLLEERLGRSL